MQALEKLSLWTQACQEILDDMRELPAVFLEKDPAARSRWEVLFLYPGVKAVIGHRIAHALWQSEHRFAARAWAEASRFLTGVEIHPGARIGRRVVIDHGMGTVIGETATVQDDVVLYQGVTLGGTELVKGVRHPTIRPGSIIGVGAVVLGNISVGPDARVGAGAVVVKDVSPQTSVAGVPAHVLASRGLRSVPPPPSQVTRE